MEVNSRFGGLSGGGGRMDKSSGNPVPPVVKVSGTGVSQVIPPTDSRTFDGPVCLLGRPSFVTVDFVDSVFRDTILMSSTEIHFPFLAFVIVVVTYNSLFTR